MAPVKHRLISVRASLSSEWEAFYQPPAKQSPRTETFLHESGLGFCVYELIVFDRGGELKVMVEKEANRVKVLGNAVIVSKGQLFCWQSWKSRGQECQGMAYAFELPLDKYRAGISLLFQVSHISLNFETRFQPVGV